MATTQPTSFPIPQSQAQAYTTPPNSQPYPQQFPPPYPQQPQQYPSHYAAMHPTSQPSTNPSPTSPSNAFDLPLANRQLRQPKSPMYIPAALRPTERHHRPAPLTPPRSVHGSTDSLNNNKASSSRPISRRSTDSKKKGILGKVNEDEPSPIPIPIQDLPTVTGPPARSHWKLDTNATICDAPVCQKHFSLWERRHHCRHCGDVFCREHSGWQIPLDQDAEFHPEGALVRACGHCWGSYERWVDERRERAGRGEEAEDRTTPVKAVLPRGGSGKVQEGRGGIAQSLTRDWNWSTF